MGTGMHKLIVIGTVVAALGLVGPAFGKPALPEGYQLPSAQPGVWSPAAVRALGLRGEAMARFYGESTGYTAQALQALGERGQAMGRFYGESSGYTSQAVKALGERGQAMGTYYGGGSVAPDWLERAALQNGNGLVGEVGRVSPDVIQSPTRNQIGVDAVGRTSPPIETAPVAGDGFEWRTVGIGAGTAALIVALGLAGVLGLRVRSTVAHP
jgi:hypothetical protein